MSSFNKWCAQTKQQFQFCKRECMYIHREVIIGLIFLLYHNFCFLSYRTLLWHFSGIMTFVMILCKLKHLHSQMGAKLHGIREWAEVGVDHQFVQRYFLAPHSHVAGPHHFSPRNWSENVKKIHVMHIRQRHSNSLAMIRFPRAKD